MKKQRKKIVNGLIASLEGKRSGGQEGKSLFSFLASKLPSFLASKPPSYRASKLPSFLATKLPSYRASKSAFSVIEIMVGLLVVSILLAAFTPIISKKLKLNSVIVEQPNTLTNNCFQTNATGAYHFGEREGDCTLCSKTACLMCNLEASSTQYLNQSLCKRVECSSNRTDPTKVDEGYKGGDEVDCLACDSSKCTNCAPKDGITSYFDNATKTCKTCPNGYYCDGVNATPCESDGFCMNGVKTSCASKYGTSCSKCNSSECETCESGSLKDTSDGSCVACDTLYGANCTKCNTTTCTRCSDGDGWGYIDGKCVQCSSKFAGCGSCTAEKCLSCRTAWRMDKTGNCVSCSSNCWACNETGCTSCQSYYGLTQDKKCKKCPEHCFACSNEMCSQCWGNYYADTNGVCIACTELSEHCTSCNKTDGCTQCESGYYLKNNECVKNDNKFRCSDTDFIKIGKLCVTRRNMGDSTTLTIPSSVKIVSANGATCYAYNSEKCCWNGQTSYSSSCSTSYSYGGCERTVCDWNAAFEICDKFNYQGKKWRLPTNNELNSFKYKSQYLNENGLQLSCQGSAGGALAASGWACYNTRCIGLGGYNSCSPGAIWGTTASGSTKYYMSCGDYEWGAGSVNILTATSFASGVRCVTEMEDE